MNHEEKAALSAERYVAVYAKSGDYSEARETYGQTLGSTGNFRIPPAVEQRGHEARVAALGELDEKAREIFRIGVGVSASFLLATVKDEGKDDRVRLKAAVALLDFGMGRPAQNVNLGGEGLKHVTFEFAEARPPGGIE